VWRFVSCQRWAGSTAAAAFFWTKALEYTPPAGGVQQRGVEFTETERGLQKMSGICGDECGLEIRKRWGSDMHITGPMIEEFFKRFIEEMDNSGHGNCKTVGKLLGYDDRRIDGICTLLSDWIECGNDKITKDGLCEAKNRGHLIGIRDVSGRKLWTATCHECCARHVLEQSIPREDDERYRKRIAEVRGLVEPKGYEVVDCPAAVASFPCHRCKCEIELLAKREDFWYWNKEREE